MLVGTFDHHDHSDADNNNDTDFNEEKDSFLPSDLPLPKRSATTSFLINVIIGYILFMCVCAFVLNYYRSSSSGGSSLMQSSLCISIETFHQNKRGIQMVDKNYIRNRVMDNEKDDNVLAVATLVLNEGRYLKEWIDFHSLIMGFQLFLIFNDNDDSITVDTTTSDVLSEYIKAGTVILIHVRASPFFDAFCAKNVRTITHKQGRCQKAVFNYAHSQLRYGDKVKWMANFDVDEFIWTPQANTSLLTLLRQPRFAEIDKVELWGPVFGTSGRSENNTAPLLETLTHRAPYYYNKNTNHADNQGPQNYLGHKALYRPGKVWEVDVHGAECAFNCRSLKVEPLDADLRFNHYQFRSRTEEHTKAVVNGNPGIDFDVARDIQLNQVEDRGILMRVHQNKLILKPKID